MDYSYVQGVRFSSRRNASISANAFMLHLCLIPFHRLPKKKRKINLARLPLPATSLLRAAASDLLSSLSCFNLCTPYTQLARVFAVHSFRMTRSCTYSKPLRLRVSAKCLRCKCMQMRGLLRVTPHLTLLNRQCLQDVSAPFCFLPLCRNIRGRGWQESARLSNGLMKETISELSIKADVLLSPAVRSRIQQLTCDSVEGPAEVDLKRSAWPAVCLRAFV